MNYFITIQGVLNEHPELASRVKSGIRPEIAIISGEVIESREFADHVNVTLRTRNGIIVHKYMMKTNKLTNPHYVAFKTIDDAKARIAAWQKRSS
jgi:hypothetical protein